MKSSQKNKLIRDYLPLLSGGWHLNRHEFVRRSLHWVQTVSLNVSHRRDEYVLRTACDFLFMPGSVTGGWLGQELLTKQHSVQWWVTLKEHESSIRVLFDEMKHQFFPKITEEINEKEIEEKLTEDVGYWPNPYALCVLSCIHQNIVNAKTYFNTFLEAISDKPYPWAMERKEELEYTIQLSSDRKMMLEYLKNIEKQRIAEFKAFC